MSETVLDDDFGALANFAEDQEKTMILNLIKQEKSEQTQEDPEQSALLEKYKEFLVFKVYGKGAFGEVTEFYDIINREKVAKKVFTNIQDYKVERDVMTRLEEALGKELAFDMLLGVSKYDAQNQTIYYRAGNCNLADLCNTRREQHHFWFDHEDQFHYIAVTLFDYVIKMADKNVYHSDLKPVNTCFVYNQQGTERYDLKFIDFGGATFHWNYLVAITPTYFPEQDVFNANESQEKRIKAEIYQVGRILQEVGLSSVYGKQSHLYKFIPEFSTYKKFIKHYMVNNQNMRNESLKLIKRYYSSDIHELISTFLDYSKGVKQCQTVLEKVRGKAKKEFRDCADFIKHGETVKMNEMFTQIKRSEERLYEELDFYLKFDFDERAEKRIQDEFDSKYPQQYKKNFASCFPRLAIYEAIFKSRMGKTQDCLLFRLINKAKKDGKQVAKGSGQEIPLKNKKSKDDDSNFIRYDQEYDMTKLFQCQDSQLSEGKYAEIEACLKDKSVSDELRLQFFQEVVGKTAHFEKQLEKNHVEEIIELLGFDDDNCPYEQAISTYHRFFIEGASLIYNGAMVKKTEKFINLLVKEAKTQEKKDVLKGFLLQLKIMFLKACYNKMDDAVNNNLDVIGNVEEGMKLFREIKKTEYGKMMQFLQLVKGFYLMKKFMIEDQSQQKQGDSRNKELEDIKEVFNKCQINMVKVGSTLMQYERDLMRQLSILADKQGNKNDFLKYEYLYSLKWVDSELIIKKKAFAGDWDKYINAQQYNALHKDDDYKNSEISDSYEVLKELTGIVCTRKMRNLLYRADIYRWTYRVWDNCVISTLECRKPYDTLYDITQLNDLSNGFAANFDHSSSSVKKQWDNLFIKWCQKVVTLEQKNDKENFAKQMTDLNKQHAFDFIKFPFKVYLLKFAVENGLRLFDEAYDFINYMKEKYVEFPEKINETVLLEMFMAVYEGNDKKFKRSQRELEEENMTGILQHQLELLELFKSNFKKSVSLKNTPEQEDANQYYYENKFCPYCDDELQYFENENSFLTLNKKLNCFSCDTNLQEPDYQIALPCYGCECKKEWKSSNHQYKKWKIYKDKIQGEQINVQYYKSYYLCLECYHKPKFTLCKMCEEPLQKAEDVYKNMNCLDGKGGFFCRKSGNACKNKSGSDQRVSGVCYMCPNCKYETESSKNWQLELKPRETLNTICSGCFNQPADSDEMDIIQAKFPGKIEEFEEKQKESEELYDNIKKFYNDRQWFLKKSHEKYIDKDISFVLDLWNKYGKNWEQYYDQELKNHKKGTFVSGSAAENKPWIQNGAPPPPPVKNQAPKKQQQTVAQQQKQENQKKVVQQQQQKPQQQKKQQSQISQQPQQQQKQVQQPSYSRKRQSQQQKSKSQGGNSRKVADQEAEKKRREEQERNKKIEELKKKGMEAASACCTIF